MQPPQVGATGVFVNFNTFVADTDTSVPSDSSDGEWSFSSPTTNPNGYISAYGGSGWMSTRSFASGSYTDVYKYVRNYMAEGNNAHMGYSTYGYLDISGDGVIGNCLRWTTIGGYDDLGEHGGYVSNKEAYRALIDAGNDPTALDGAKVGHPYIYFQNTSKDPEMVAFQEAAGSNRLSMYIWLPGDVVNDSGLASYYPPKVTISVGPYNSVGGHFYHRAYVQGGGWIKFIVDGHPQHNNAWDNAAEYPYPSSSLRDYGEDYFRTMYRWYVTFLPYDGIAVPKYEVRFDEIEFYNDTEPQNNETINTPTIGYYPNKKSFEISFCDKYKNNKDSWSTYELRYSFAPITNANWGSATQVHTLTDDRFKKAIANTTGTISKQWPYYLAVWAPFKLATQVDTNSLTEGKKVYFAIKDISQSQADTLDPVGYKLGRNYRDNAANYDYAGDAPVLDLIKRIDYTIASGPMPVTAPSLSLINNSSPMKNAETTATVTGTAIASAGRIISTVAITSGTGTISGTTSWTLYCAGIPVGDSTYTVRVTDDQGEHTDLSFIVTRATAASPTVFITQSSQTVSNTPASITITGTTTNATSVTCSTGASNTGTVGSFEFFVVDLSLGANVITITASDGTTGVTSSVTITRQAAVSSCRVTNVRIK